MPSVYIETSIVGYLTARSRDVVLFQARQELTRTWWEVRRGDFDLVTSQLVLDEAGSGDPQAAAERLDYLSAISLLDVSEKRIAPLADLLLHKNLLPTKARSDAIHVATAAVFQIDYLLTWNCKHIANADTLPKIYRLISAAGYTPPLIVTPEEFSGNV